MNVAVFASRPLICYARFHLLLSKIMKKLTEITTEQKLEIAVNALKRIGYPLDYLRQYAEDGGKNLDPMMTIKYLDNADILKAIAKDALDEISSRSA